MVSNALAASSALTQWSVSTAFAHAWFCIGHEGELVSFSALGWPKNLIRPWLSSTEGSSWGKETGLPSDKVDRDFHVRGTQLMLSLAEDPPAVSCTPYFAQWWYLQMHQTSWQPPIVRAGGHGLSSESISALTFMELLLLTMQDNPHKVQTQDTCLPRLFRLGGRRSSCKGQGTLWGSHCVVLLKTMQLYPFPGWVQSTIRFLLWLIPACKHQKLLTSQSIICSWWCLWGTL